MPDPTYILLYVDDPARSEAFYRKILGGAEPVASSPTFVLFATGGGLMLGLWSKHEADPAPAAGPGSSDIGFRVAEKADVDRAFEQWTKDGVEILQAPRDLDFGRSLVGADPDGHRLRVFTVNPG